MLLEMKRYMMYSNMVSVCAISYNLASCAQNSIGYQYSFFYMK